MTAVKFIKVIHIPEITEAEYIAQVKDVYGDDVTDAEALELLYADADLDAPQCHNCKNANNKYQHACLGLPNAVPCDCKFSLHTSENNLRQANVERTRITRRQLETGKWW